MLHLSVRCVISLFFLEKQSEIRNAFTFFEKWKVKKIILSLFLRNEKWNDFLFHSFREVKVKLKYLEIEIEKWNFKIILENSRETRLSLVTATWWPNLQLIQVALIGGQLWNCCKWRQFPKVTQVISWCLLPVWALFCCYLCCISRIWTKSQLLCVALWQIQSSCASSFNAMGAKQWMD